MNHWISKAEKLPKYGQKVLCKYEGVYDFRVVTYWETVSGEPRFGLLNEGDGMGIQPATHWAPMPTHNGED